MYISCLIGFVIIFSYCIFVAIKDKEIPNSISQTVYSLDNNHKWIFSAVMVIISFMILPQLLEVVPIGYEFLSYLTVLGIIGVGIDPLDKDKKNIIHYVSAIIMGVSSQILIYIMNPYLFLLWIPYIVYTMYKDDGRKNMFLSEMVMLSDTSWICLI